MRDGTVISIFNGDADDICSPILERLRVRFYTALRLRRLGGLSGPLSWLCARQRRNHCPCECRVAVDKRIRAHEPTTLHTSPSVALTHAHTHTRRSRRC